MSGQSGRTALLLTRSFKESSEWGGGGRRLHYTRPRVCPEHSVQEFKLVRKSAIVIREQARRRAAAGCGWSALAATLPASRSSQRGPDPEWDKVVAAARKEGSGDPLPSKFTPVSRRFQSAWNKAYPDITPRPPFTSGPP